jgi:hypothetical protein
MNATQTTEAIMTSPTYDEIVDNWELWAEYASPMGTREEFDAMTREGRMAMMHECFGPETQTTEATRLRADDYENKDY